jgi:hypothetical protein
MSGPLFRTLSRPLPAGLGAGRPAASGASTACIVLGSKPASSFSIMIRSWPVLWASSTLTLCAAACLSTFVSAFRIR